MMTVTQNQFLPAGFEDASDKMSPKKVEMSSAGGIAPSTWTNDQVFVQPALTPWMNSTMSMPGGCELLGGAYPLHSYTCGQDIQAAPMMDAFAMEQLYAASKYAMQPNWGALQSEASYHWMAYAQLQAAQQQESVLQELQAVDATVAKDRLVLPEAVPLATSTPATNSQSPTSSPAQKQVQTLACSLQLLSDEDPDTLFIVRRINKLGFKASRTLKKHFSSVGKVVQVLVAHSTVKQHGEPASQAPSTARRRPSSLGFVQMCSVEGCRKVLAMGAEQEVDGVMIKVQKFQRPSDDAARGGEEDDDDTSVSVSTETGRVL